MKIVKRKGKTTGKKERKDGTVKHPENNEQDGNGESLSIIILSVSVFNSQAKDRGLDG